MALPYILAPAGTPPFRIEDHSSKQDEIYASVAYRRGHSRLRRLYVGSMPRVVTVSWELSASQMAAVDDWAEDTLQAYTRAFSAQVASTQGVGVLYYNASWVEPYAAEPLDGERWVVTGSLYLTGDGQVDPPPQNLFTAEIFVNVTGTAVLDIDAKFYAEMTVYFGSVQNIGVEISVPVMDFNTPPPPPPPPVVVPPGPAPYGYGLRSMLLPDGSILAVGSDIVFSPDSAFIDLAHPNIYKSIDGLNYKFTEHSDLPPGSGLIIETYGVFNWAVIVGSTLFSVGLNGYANIAEQILGTTSPELVAAVRKKNSNGGSNDVGPREEYTGFGWPRTGDGKVIATGDMFGDGGAGLSGNGDSQTNSLFYIIGRDADQQQDADKAYLYSAGTDAVFTNLGPLTLQAGGFFSARYIVPTYIRQDFFNPISCDMKKYNGRWFMNGFNLWYTDDAVPLGNWVQANVGFSEGPTSPSDLLEITEAGGYLIEFDGASYGQNPLPVSLSSDNGSTWTASTMAGSPVGMGLLRSPRVLNDRVFVYFYLGADPMVAYADAPYSSWTYTLVTGLPRGTYLGGYPVYIGNAFINDATDNKIYYTEDGINFELTRIITYTNREDSETDSPPTKHRMIRQDGVGFFQRETYGL